jgi:hypothetical protein
MPEPRNPSHVAIPFQRVDYPLTSRLRHVSQSETENMPQLATLNTGNCDTCGSVLPISQVTGPTGYGITADGKKHCYRCCANQDVEHMKANGAIVLYWSKSSDGVWQITNWPNSLSFKPLSASKSYGYGFGHRYDVYNVTFRGPDGFVWCGRNAGDNQILRCRRTKQKSNL